MHKPFFSVVIPALNEEKFISNLLEDLEKQSFKDFDVWVVDGKSDDKTQIVVKKFVNKNKNFNLLESNRRHVSVQRNHGAKTSTGEFIQFFDADVRIPNFYLEGVHYEWMKQGFDAWTTMAVPDTSEPKDVLMLKLYNIILDTTQKLNSPAGVGASIGSSRKVFEDTKGFDEDISYAEDVKFLADVHKKGYQLELLKDPMFTMNMRRMKKEGYIHLGTKMLPFVLKTLQGKKIVEPVDAYPMLGGSYFLNEKKMKKKNEMPLGPYIAELQKAIRKQRKEVTKLVKDAFGEF